MKYRVKRLMALIGTGMMMTAALAGCGTKTPQKETSAQKEFSPVLDTEQNISIGIAGFMANFEALDQVINDFNAYYPNVIVTYEQNARDQLAEYLENNDAIDIFMTTDAQVRDRSLTEGYVFDRCLDLSKENADTSAMDPELLKACTVDGALVRIPLAKMMCGMVVNQTLLEAQGLSVPQTYAEFLNVCEQLKNKGYTPIQASKYHVCSDMVLPMAMAILGNDQSLVNKIDQDDKSYVESLRPVYERLSELIERGYLSASVNEAYPDDNYDGAILKFFEGDVPFWIANTESFSGMKKRESKSETFAASPFEYAFVNVPLGDDGVYDYEEPWYGFSVNKNSAHVDYAVEFMRFLMQEQELNILAQTKGMPAVTINNSDDRFQTALHPQNMAARYVMNGELSMDITSPIADAANQLGYGDLTGVDEVLEYIKSR